MIDTDEFLLMQGCVVVRWFGLKLMLQRFPCEKVLRKYLEYRQHETIFINRKNAKLPDFFRVPEN